MCPVPSVTANTNAFANVPCRIRVWIKTAGLTIRVVTSTASPVWPRETQIAIRGAGSPSTSERKMFETAISPVDAALMTASAECREEDLPAR